MHGRTHRYTFTVCSKITGMQANHLHLKMRSNPYIVIALWYDSIITVSVIQDQGGNVICKWAAC